MATEIAGPAEKPPIRADALKFALAFALRSVRLDRHRLGLSEETRYRIAGEAVDRPLRDGRWPELKQARNCARWRQRRTRTTIGGGRRAEKPTRGA